MHLGDDDGASVQCAGAKALVGSGCVLEGELLDTDVGQWVYDHQKPAGHGTDTLPAAAALYLPLKAPMRTRGVLAVVVRDERELDVPEQERADIGRCVADKFGSDIADYVRLRFIMRKPN